MTFTVLVENTAPPSLTGEHGLSLLICHRGHTLLLDGGQSAAGADNAGRLGAALGQVELVVLSHGHYDHADGLPPLLEKVPADVPVYLRPQALAPHYHGDDPAGRYIGVSPQAAEVLRPRARWVEGVTALYPGGWLVPGGVDHQQSLVLDTGGGLVVFNSCCHGGAGFLLREIRETFPSRPLLALVGGLHLMGAGGAATLGVSPGIVKNLGKWLFDELGVGRLYTGHCTGAPTLALLEEGYPRRVTRLTTGMTVTLEEKEEEA